MYSLSANRLNKGFLDLYTPKEIIDFYYDLPKKPYCTDEKNHCYIRAKNLAIKHAYIQPNHPAMVKWLVFDLDFNNALFAYYDNNLPYPQLIIKNPSNGHAHYCYKLTEEIGLWGNSSEKAIRYLDAVYTALRLKLGADPNYAGNLVKNPLHSNWITYTTGAKNSYTLADLADYLELGPTAGPKQALNDSHFSRNCSVFNAIRHKAYAIAHQYDYNGLYSEILAIAKAENARLNNPLFLNELHHISKSIARYCKSPRFLAISKAWFSRLQAYRGSKGGKVSKRGKSKQSARTQKPWEALGISRKTYYKRKKNNTLRGDQISHKSDISP